MIRADPTIQGVTIVLVGRFNPAIFQPRWLAAHSLIRPEEADNAKIGIIHPDIASFTAGWLRIAVEAEKFIAATQDPAHYPPLRDLVVGVFSILEHTPVTKLGLNQQMHFPADTLDDMHACGDRLAPKQSWVEVVGEPGLRSIEILGKLPESGAEHISVTVEPSVRERPGVYVATNEQYDLGAEGQMQRALQVLATRWEEALSYSMRAARHVLRPDPPTVDRMPESAPPHPHKNRHSLTIWRPSRCP